MPGKLKAIALCIACLALSACLNLGDGTPTVAVVDVDRVLREAKAAAAARSHVAEAQKQLKTGWEQLQKTWENAPKEQREKALAEGLQALNRQMAIEEAAARNVVLAMLREEAHHWRKEHGAQIVVPLQGLLDADAAVDITSSVIRAMDARKANFAALPRVEIKNPAGEAEGASPSANSQAKPAKR